MASELSPQSIREVRFREKLRGYHPEDVDTFVAEVAATVEALHRRINELAAASPAVAGVQPGEQPDTSAAHDTPSDVEESLRRTLILAQRTADMAVKEAQEEAERLVSDAHAQRESVLTDAEALRARTMAELENELSGYRQRLHDERDALQRDVGALQTYVAQERERLRIYFSDQLHRVEDGVPGYDQAPVMEGPDEPTTVADDIPGLSEQVDASGTSEAAPTIEDGALAEEARPEEVSSDDDNDPFLAELRRAVNDNEPLGPRDEEVALPPRDEKDFDIFNDDDGGGRFLRRRR